MYETYVLSNGPVSIKGIKDFKTVALTKRSVLSIFDDIQASKIDTLHQRIFPNIQSDYAVVFLNDDLILNVDNVDERIKTTNKDMKDVPWDVIYLSYCLEVCWLQSYVKTGIRKAFNPLCAGVLLFNKNSVDKLVSCVKKQNNSLDVCYKNCIFNEEINAYCVHPPLYKQKGALKVPCLERGGFKAIVAVLVFATVLIIMKYVLQRISNKIPFDKVLGI